MTETEHFPWEDQLVEIKSRVGWSIKAFTPLLQHRWKLFARKRQTALQKLYNLPPNTISAILEHLYANCPIARTNLPAFKNCSIVSDLPFQSTYRQDILNLLHDTETCDFSLLANDSDEPVRVHRFILYARCGFFRRNISENPNFLEYRDQNMSKNALPMFAEYLYTGELEVTDPVAAIDLVGSGKTYEFRDQDEIDFLAMNAITKQLTEENAAPIRKRAVEKNMTNLVTQIDAAFPHSS
ncbi:hypothetical protein TRFO_04889 [Tritrichomonas foetus]|uniref:BTB domain-containing protein n=1 Tax=Tritrichomonas foetus TaxID=1144522 RepID=A0A1J4KG08_9EUKA|nr:hypothetical protein TRFO_04889 [Tritrichomonas foetus]|eukprot:OHT08285.1 hypothetical protein TRFO_04889 [Tritrichomonas foetus]